MEKILKFLNFKSYSKMSNVYIMVDEDGIFKIGKSDDPLRRRKQIESERRKKVDIYAWLPHDDAYAFEAQLHRIYSDWNRGQDREWFAVSKIEVHNIIRKYGFIASVDAITDAVTIEIEKQYDIMLDVAKTDLYFAEMEKKEILGKLERVDVERKKYKEKSQKREIALHIVAGLAFTYAFYIGVYAMTTKTEFMMMLVIVLFSAITMFVTRKSIDSYINQYREIN